MQDAGLVQDPRLSMLRALERKVLWLSSWTIHQANHLRPNEDGLKVGGHQASSASLATIMTALYFAILRPEDRVAVKPHASPVFHAIQYLLGNQTREKLERFRGFKGAQSYPSRTKDIDDVDFSTGSVGLGVAQTLFASLVQTYVGAHGWLSEGQGGRMVALAGDAEFDEGNLFEALLEGWKHNVQNCWWIIDYNRQSLDAVVHEGLRERLEDLFRNFGWRVVTLKYGHLQEAAFAEPGGERLRQWIDACPNQLYAALCFQGGAAWRRRLLDELGDQGPLTALIERRSDEELSALMMNLGGHDLPGLLAAFESNRDATPTCFIAYTIKGMGLPMQGHKDNHAGLMTKEQMQALQTSFGIPEGQEWDRFAAIGLPAEEVRRFLDRVPFNARGPRRYAAARVPVPPALPLPKMQPSMSTQQGFGLILAETARLHDELASRIVTTSPDVTVSTNLGGWVNRRGRFAVSEAADIFKHEKIPSTFNWSAGPKGQHMELGIAEMNLFLLLSALGLSHSLFGQRLLPVGTLYDPFIQRGLDALNYACYQDARFIVAATPSGITLAPEGGAHQSIATPLIGIAQPGLAAFEPAYVDELAVILRFALDFMQNDGTEGPESQSWLPDETGGSVYLRLSTRSIEQPQRQMTRALADAITLGGYWLREPGANCEIVVAYSGAVAPAAIEAVGLMAEDRRDIGLLAVTSADRLHAAWTAAERARRRGVTDGPPSHVEKLLGSIPRTAGIVTVVDGHPLSLAWLGGVHGHKTKSLGVENFGQTGTIGDLHKAYAIDANAIIEAAESAAPSHRIRHRKLTA